MINIIVVIISMFLLLAAGALVMCFGKEKNNPIVIGIGVSLWIVAVTLVWQIVVCKPSVEDPDKESFYKIVRIDVGNGISKQVAIILGEQIMNVGTIGESLINAAKIYPDDAILRKYGYNAGDGWIKYDNRDTFYYEIILPSDDRYEEGKEKIVEMKIISEE